MPALRARYVAYENPRHLLQSNVLSQIQTNSVQIIVYFLTQSVFHVFRPLLIQFFYYINQQQKAIMNQIYWGDNQFIIWKKSQYLGRWDQRLLSMSDPSVIKTAKQQSVNSKLNANFSIPCSQIKKISIYPKKFIEDGEKVSLKVEYTRTTLMADSQNLMIRLFGTIVRGKFMFDKQGVLEKQEIKGNDMFTTQKIEKTFIIFRKDGLFNKEFKRQQMFITKVRLMCYDKIGFGKNMGTPNWSIDRKDLRKITTEFQTYKNNLVVNLCSRFTSCQIAVPAQGNQLLQLLHILCRGDNQDIYD